MDTRRALGRSRGHHDLRPVCVLVKTLCASSVAVSSTSRVLPTAQAAPFGGSHESCTHARPTGATVDQHLDTSAQWDVVRNPGRVSSVTDIGVPAVWRIGSVV